MRNSLIKGLFLCILASLILGCSSKSYDISKQERSDIAKAKDEIPQSEVQKSDKVWIGIAWAKTENDFYKGIELAIEEVNARGGILGRDLDYIANGGEAKTYLKGLNIRQRQKLAINIARSFASDPYIVAVIGHRYSSHAIPASVVYQYNGILFIAPTSTNVSLTSHNFSYTFRMFPNNENMGRQLAAYAYQMGFKKIVMLHDRQDYSIELADTFLYTAAETYNIDVILRRSFFGTREDFTSIMTEINQLKPKLKPGESAPVDSDGKPLPVFDAFFVSTGAATTGLIYHEARNMSMFQPFIGGDAINSDDFWNVVRPWEIDDAKFPKKSVAVTLFNRYEQRETVQNFQEKFKERYGEEAHHWAAIGYDAIQILSQAMIKARSTMPEKVAESLRYMPYCEGLTGTFKYYTDGDIFMDLPLLFKSVQGKIFHYASLKKEVMQQLLDKLKADGKYIPADIPDKLGICGDVDIDKDSIPNDLDACPNNTPEELALGIVENGVKRGCPKDTDNDSIPDYKEAEDCMENTKEEISKGVDDKGCPLDTDEDKVADYIDECPKNLMDSKNVDDKGCAIDTDKDGVPDDMDVCKEDTEEDVFPGVYIDGERLGCPKDDDEDNVPNYKDQCPENLMGLKTVDEKGCVPDADGDLIPDEMDVCPEDDAEGVALSGVYEEGERRGCLKDDDGDGIPNHQDNCPNNLMGLKHVDDIGCVPDTDKDLIPDELDQCAEDSEEAISKGVYRKGEQMGCPVDIDKDGVLDYQDACPGDTPLSEEEKAKIGDDGCHVDKDNDGVLNVEDQCPDNTADEIAKGVDQTGDTKGCPIDTDKDGVADYQDTCPESMTTKVDAKGCPIDTDKDGFTDDIDNCPNDTPLTLSKGIYQTEGKLGCPIDTDQDGVPDYQDRCEETNTAFVIKEDGCELINSIKIVRYGNDSFVYDSSNLTQIGKDYLQDFIEQLDQETLVSIEIVGHTDNIGPSDFNLSLSQQRATSVEQFIADLGIPIDKILAWGNGEEHPVAPNDTEEGRTMNRRFELIVRHYQRKEVQQPVEEVPPN